MRGKHLYDDCVTTLKKTVVASRRGRIPASEVATRNSRILDSATEVFLEAGFARAKMTVIARKAGCSLETLYTAYPNKEAMFGALITRKALGTFDAMGPLSPERNLREALVRYAVEMLAMMARPDTRGLHALVIGESRNFPELAKNFWNEGYGRALEVVKIFFAAKNRRESPKIADPACAAEVYLALLLGDMCMRSTLGLKTLSDTKRQQLRWAESCVDMFLTLLAQGKV